LPNLNSVEPDLSILGCPPEDIAEYPVLEPISPPLSPSGEPIAESEWCQPAKLSIEKLLFSKQGGTRCITSTSGIQFMIAKYEERYLIIEGEGEFLCPSENIILSDAVNHASYEVKKLRCPWFTITVAVDNKRILHISADQNETGSERKSSVYISTGNCGTYFTITQSSE
jgi:hypothetical protein